MVIMEDNTIKVIEELNPVTLERLIGSLGSRILIVKFSAVWCGPCKTIKDTVYECVAQFPAERLVFADLDADRNAELYGMMKSKRMVNGIPVMLAYDGRIKRDRWYIPDDSITGGNISPVKQFFLRCAERVKGMM